MSKLDRRITIFKLKEDTDGNNTRVNVYNSIHAAFRQLSDSERVTTQENGTQSTCRFEINRMKVTLDMYVEFTRPIYGTTIYQVTSVDDFHEHERHMVIGCREIQHELVYESEEVDA